MSEHGEHTDDVAAAVLDDVETSVHAADLDAADVDLDDVAADAVEVEESVEVTVALVDADDDLLVLEEAQIELPVWEPTGDAEVDAAVAMLGQLDDTDLAGHVETFAEVHRQLRQRLTDVASG